MYFYDRLSSRNFTIMPTMSTYLNSDHELIRAKWVPTWSHLCLLISAVIRRGLAKLMIAGEVLGLSYHCILPVVEL